jgi:hypothetical protein
MQGRRLPEARMRPKAIIGFSPLDMYSIQTCHRSSKKKALGPGRRIGGSRAKVGKHNHANVQFFAAFIKFTQSGNQAQ